MIENRVQRQFSGFLRTHSLWLKNDIFEYPLFHVPKLTTYKISPEVVPEPSASVLGKRVEEFFRFYIQHYSEEEVLAFNEQIIQDKITLGELDFILKNPITSEISHVELVYKFYLYDPDLGEREEEHWVGPNKRDFLVRKLRHLKERQFPLLRQPATAALLDRLKIPVDQVVQKLCFKANLFVPFEFKAELDNVNPAAVQGFWVRRKEFFAGAFENMIFYSPKKQDWPILPEYNELWLSFDDFKPLILEMLDREQSPLVWMKTPSNQFRRFFVVWW